MSQGKRINITPAARADLEDIYIYGFQHVGEKRADTYLERFYNAFDTLGSYEVGLRRDEIKTGVRSLPVARHAIWFSRVLSTFLLRGYYIRPAMCRIHGYGCKAPVCYF